jgi:transcriptional regulator with XRE-family HTH domain
MRFLGRVFRSGAYWPIEVPILGVFTQGRSLKDAYVMIADAIESLVNRPGFSVRIFEGFNGEFEIGASDEAILIAFFLRRIRIRSKMTLAQVAARLGEKSINGYARYEQGRAIPSIKKLSQLYAVVGRNGDFVLVESRIEPGARRRTKPERPHGTAEETLAAARLVREKTKSVWLNDSEITRAKRSGRR